MMRGQQRVLHLQSSESSFLQATRKHRVLTCLFSIDDTGSDFELEELPLNKQVSLGLSSSFSIRTAQKEFQQAIRETLEARKLRIQVETLADHIEEIKRRQQKEKSSEVKPPEPETTDNNEEKSE